MIPYRPQIDPRAIPDPFQVHPRSIPDRSLIDRRSTPDRSQIDPGSILLVSLETYLRCSPRDPGGLRAPPSESPGTPQGLSRDYGGRPGDPQGRSGDLRGRGRTPNSTLQKNTRNTKSRKSTKQLQIPMKMQIRLFNVSLSTPRNTRPCAAKCENSDSDWVPFLVNFESLFEVFLCRSSNGLFCACFCCFLNENR